MTVAPNPGLPLETLKYTKGEKYTMSKGYEKGVGIAITCPTLPCPALLVSLTIILEPHISAHVP